MERLLNTGLANPEQAEFGGLVTLEGELVGLANPLPVQPGAGTVFNVSGTTLTPSATFTRPSDTTQYAVGDLVANSTTAGSVTALALTCARTAAGYFTITKVRLRKSGTSVTNAAFRVHLYLSAPTASNGDNGAYLTNNVANYLGAFDVNSMMAFSDGAAGNGAAMTSNQATGKLPSGLTCHALIEARAAYTPASGETFTVTLESIPD